MCINFFLDTTFTKMEVLKISAGISLVGPVDESALQCRGHVFDPWSGN